ncbi:M48 family metallopeptidase [Brevibacterium jeotgali]|nr:M48 family metallopeptidase [Brevibacterium jeotgali]
MDVTEVLAAIDDGTIIVRRSARRRKTISLKREGDRWLLAVPQRFQPERNVESIASLIARMERRAVRTSPGDDDLLERALDLNTRYFDDGIEPASVVWVSNQNTRFASTTSARRTIQVSSRLAAVPGWVLDAVLVHELAHLRRPDHSPAFHALTARYPHTTKADVFLEGFSYGEGSRKHSQD